MRKYLFVMLLSVLFLGCSLKENKNPSIIQLVPENTQILIKINDFQSLKEELVSNEIFKKLKSTNPYKQISNKLQSLSYLEGQNKATLALAAKDTVSFDFTYFTQDSIYFSKVGFEKLKSKVVDTETSSNYSILNYQFEEFGFFSTQINNYYVLSSSKEILQNILKNENSPNQNESLQQFIKVASDNKVLNLWIDFKNGYPLLSQTFSKDLRIQDFSSWMSLDLSMDNSEILLSGIATPDSTSSQTLNLFSNTRPISNTLAQLAPIESSYLKTYSFNDFKLFSQHPKQPLKELDSLLTTVEEIALVEIEDQKLLYLKTYGTANLLDYINNKKTTTEEINGNQIWRLKKDINLFKPLIPLIGENQFNYVGLIENTFLFAKSKNSLSSALSNYKNGNVFEKSNLYKNTLTNLSENDNMLTISNLKGAVHLIESSISKTIAEDFSNSNLKNHVFGSQFIADDGFFHALFFVKSNKKQVAKNTVSNVFELQFENDLSSSPQFVINHNNGKKEVLVQDQDNVLYLISNRGKIIWKKQLNGAIQGKVAQVDLFKNGKLQIAFTTNNQFLILDRNGKEVAPFSMKFEGGNLNPLAVFDYDNKRKYRFVVTQNKKIFMYNNEGKIVKGFKYITAEASILSKPRHFRIEKKDYLTFQLDNSTLKITNRVGKDRVSVKDKFSFSENPITIYQNKFSFTTTDGVLNQIDTKGKISRTNLNLLKDHGMDATSRTLAIMNDNVLRIRDKKVNLDLGVYTQPTIFYLNDKIYVSVTDIQNQKIFLFDSQAEPIPNFPIYGSSAIDMADIDNDKKPELVFKDQANSIKVVKIQ